MTSAALPRRTGIDIARWRLAISYLTVFLAIIYLGAIWLYPQDSEAGDGLRSGEKWVRIAFQLTVGLGCALSFRNTIASLLRLPGLLAFSAIAVLSTTWSSMPGDTAFAARGLVFVVVSAAVVASILNLRQFVFLFVALVSVFIVASLVLGIVMPGYAKATMGPHAGLLHGLFPHKNILGHACFVVVNLALCGALYDERLKRILPAIVSVAFIALVLSGSVTALTMSIFSVGWARATAWYVNSNPQRRLFMFTMTILIGAAAGVVFLSAGNRVFEALLGAIGKDPTLTGRTRVWELFASFASQRPVLGWGFGAFGQGFEIMRLRTALNFASLRSAHSGYLQMWLDVGLLGVIAFVGQIAAGLFAGIAGDRGRIRPSGHIMLCFLLPAMIYAGVETVSLNFGLGFWTFVVLSVFAARKPEADAARGVYAPNHSPPALAPT